MPQPATTRWSLIARAADADGADATSALAALCELWRPAVFGFLRGRVGAQSAEDLTQGFFLHFIESGLAARADPARGRFRSYLYASLGRWCIDEARARRAGKRGGDAVEVPWDEASLFDPADAPDAAFDRSWAACMVREAIRRLRDEAVRNNRVALFEAAQPFLLEGPDFGDYAQAAASVAMSSNTFAVAVGRLRKRLQAIIRAMVEDTTVSRQDATAELRHLRSALGRP